MGILLPSGIHVFERGWLSSNNILIEGAGNASLVDSGYCTHSDQTLALVQSALGDQPLDCLLNTHLHSDHCGGNAALQARYPSLRTLIPPGHAPEVARWDASALSYAPTGQDCPRFTFDALLHPGTDVQLGAWLWQVHPAGGHDPHSVILFEPQHGLLLSADALWEQGFGVVFPELDGVDAFDDVAATLDLIETLGARMVVPGHGRPFTQVTQALKTARARLEYFAVNPERHRNYAAKVLLKFKILDWQSCTLQALLDWGQGLPYMERLHRASAPDQSIGEFLQGLLADLERGGALRRSGTHIDNLG